MNFSVEVSDNFKKEAKRLIKKYSSLNTEIADLLVELETNLSKGIPLGKNIYKIRLAVAPKGKGKSGGTRVMSLVYFTDITVLLFSIFDKSAKESISDKEIKSLIKKLIKTLLSPIHQS